MPRTTREIGGWIAREYGIDYQGRSGLIALLHRLGLEHRKPTAISRQLDRAKQVAFIQAYEALLNRLSGDEAVMFADAVHPTHAVRPVGCWAPKDVPVAITQSSGRDRLNIHGAIDLQTGQVRMLDVLVVDAMSTIMLLTAIEAMHPRLRLIHVFLDNARYHHAKLVQQWLTRPGCRIRLHFVRPIVPISMRSNDYGDRCTSTSPTTGVPQVHGFQRSHPDLSAPRSAQQLEQLLRSGLRQLPRHQPKGFSGSRVSEVY